MFVPLLTPSKSTCFSFVLWAGALMQLPLHAESCTISNSAAGFNTELGLISSQIINNLSRSQEETSLPYKGEKKHTLQWPA